MLKKDAIIDTSIIDSPLKLKVLTTFEIENNPLEDKQSDEDEDEDDDKDNENNHHIEITIIQKGADSEERWIKKSGK